MILYDFKCSHCGAEFEEYVESGVDITECNKCGSGSAKRQLSMPHFAYMRMGLDPTMTTAAAKWAKAHEDGAITREE